MTDTSERLGTLGLVTLAYAGLLCLWAAWGLGQSTFSTLSRPEAFATRIDLSPLAPGEPEFVRWGNKVVIVMRLTEAQVAAGQADGGRDPREPHIIQHASSTGAPADFGARAFWAEGWFVVYEAACGYFTPIPLHSDWSFEETWMCIRNGRDADALGRFTKYPFFRDFPVPVHRLSGPSELMLIDWNLPMSEAALDRLLYGS